MPVRKPGDIEWIDPSKGVPPDLNAAPFKPPTDSESDVAGPFIRWDNYGHEGWKPSSHETLIDALTKGRYCSEFIITKPVKFEIIEDNG